MKPHIAILGAGPIGLEAALAAAEGGYPFTLYEAAPEVAGSVASWSHVSLFTPWDLNVSPGMRAALTAAGHDLPEGDDCPTGGELIERVLRPIAELPQIRDHIELAAEVRRIGRQGLLKHEEIGSAERGRRPFRLLVRSDGGERIEEADVVLDCTGLTEPNPVGDGGIPALGEEALDGAISHRIPDLAHEAADWAGQRVLLIGAGHSAQTAIRDLLGHDDAGIRVVWALRSEKPNLEPVADDPLPERSRLTAAAARLAAGPPPSLDLRTGVAVDAFEPHEGAIRVTLRRADGTTESVTVDRVLALTGRVGDHQLYRQLQVHECYATSGPMKLAAALLGAGGSAGGDCLQQTSQGADTLKNPEPGFFILGSKSYGRRNDFLMRVGWQQVGEVFELL